MKDKLYDIMSDLNEILKDMDSMVTVAEIQFNGIKEVLDTEIAQSILKTHIRLLKGIMDDTDKIYNKIDETILDMKYERI